MPQITAVSLVSAVLVSWNRREQLRAALDSLFAQNYPELEVLVADNGSTDGTSEMLASDYAGRVTVLPMGRNVGPAVARNAAVAAARGTYLLFMDSDAVLLTPKAIANLVAQLEREARLAAVTGVIYLDRECRNVWLWGGKVDPWGYIDIARSRGPGHPVDVVSTCFSVARRESIVKAGGFDPFYFYMHEDTDLFLRIARMGYRFAVDRNVAVWHDMRPDGRKPTSLFDRARHFEYRRIYMMLKLYGLSGYLRSLPGTLGHYRRLLDDLGVPRLTRAQELYLFGVMPLAVLWLYAQAKAARQKRFLPPS